MYSIIIMGAWLRYEQLLLLAHNVRTRRRRKEGRKEDIVEDPWNNSELTDCREARSCSCKQKDGYRRGDLKGFANSKLKISMMSGKTLGKEISGIVDGSNRRRRQEGHEMVINCLVYSKE